jgi:galactokinase
LGIYEELVRMHEEEGLSFADVVVFNVSEFFPVNQVEYYSNAKLIKTNLLDKHISESKLAYEYLNKIRPLQTLDEFTEDEFESMVSTISNLIAIKSAYHVISEVHRTKKAAKALKKGDLTLFGLLMNTSHESLRDNLGIVSPEVDAMVTEALKIEGVIGSRMAGCGFGGCTISLVKDEAIDLFVKRVGDIYEDITGIKNQFYIAEICDCACKLYN